MVKHSGGKISKVAKTLSNKNSSKKQKSDAGKELKKHQDKKH